MSRTACHKPTVNRSRTSIRLAICSAVGAGILLVSGPGSAQATEQAPTSVSAPAGSVTDTVLHRITTITQTALAAVPSVPEVHDWG